MTFIVYPNLISRKKRRIYKQGALGRPKQKYGYQEGPTLELIRKRKALYGKEVFTNKEVDTQINILSPLLGSSIGLLRFYGMLNCKEYEAAKWFAFLVHQWRRRARCPSYAASRITPVPFQIAKYTYEVPINTYEERKEEKREKHLQELIKLLQKESPNLYSMLREITVEDRISPAFHSIFLRTSRNKNEIIVLRKEEQEVAQFLRDLRKGLLIVFQYRKKIG